MKTNQRLFFVALLPPPPIQKLIQKIKQEFAVKYHSQHGLKSPPHITLQPPFKWDMNQVRSLEGSLENFAKSQKPIPITLKDFNAFKPRVIYIDVIKNSELLNLQQELTVYLQSNLNLVDQGSKSRSFTPHLTIAHRDLTRSNYNQAWKQYQHETIYFEFTVSGLTLLLHQDKRWQVYRQFDFQWLEAKEREKN